MADQTANSFREPIRIVLRDQVAVFPALVRDVIACNLSPRLPKTNETEMRTEKVRFWWDGEDGEVLVRPLLVPRVMAALDPKCFSVQIVDERDSPHFAIADVAQFKKAGTALQHEIMQAAAQWLHGQILIKESASTATSAASVAQLFHNEKVLMIASDSGKAQHLAAQLSCLVNVPVSAEQYRWHDGPRIHIDSVSGCIGRTIEDWPVVIVADRKAAVAKSVIDQVGYMTASRVYAILPENCRFDFEDQLRLETLCGPEIYRQKDDATDLTEVEVFYLKAVTYPPDSIRDALERKRVNIWHNDQRNRLIAKMAQSLCTLDCLAMRVSGVDQTSTVKDLLQSKRMPRVVILAETHEHARDLQSILPTWKVYADACERRRDYLPLDAEQAIVTIPYAALHGISADVVVRAAGIEHKWNDAFGPHSCLNDRYMLIIDVTDDFDIRANDDARNRRADYQRRNWSEQNA